MEQENVATPIIHSIVTDRISLLSNNLPNSDMNEVEDGMAKLFLSNLSLRRKNARLNKFNNKLHKQINNTRNNVLINIDDSRSGK